jgi:hypothetical protein
MVYSWCIDGDATNGRDCVMANELTGLTDSWLTDLAAAKADHHPMATLEPTTTTTDRHPMASMVPAGAWNGNRLDLANVATSVRGWIQAAIAKLASKPESEMDAAVTRAAAADMWAVLADGLAPMPDESRLNHNLPESYALQHEAAQRVELPWPGFVS